MQRCLLCKAKVSLQLEKRVMGLAQENHDLRLAATKNKMMLYTQLKGIEHHIHALWQHVIQAEERSGAVTSSAAKPKRSIEVRKNLESPPRSHRTTPS